jgi:hypothetical protein
MSAVLARKTGFIASAPSKTSAWLGLETWKRLSDGKLWPHDPKLFTLNVIETEYRPEAVAPRCIR